MTITCRPLHLDEVRYAYGLRCRSREIAAGPLEEYLPLQPPQKMVDLFGGLVSTTDGVLRFTHTSVRDFLIRPEDRWVQAHDQAVLEFRIDMAKEHRSLAWLCLDYLVLHQDNQGQLTPEAAQTVRSSFNDQALQQYATLYTFFHLNRLGPLCSITLAKITNVFESTRIVFWIEQFHHYLFQHLFLQSQLNEYEAFQERMYDAGLDMRLFACFQHNLKEMIVCSRKSGEAEESRVEQWEMLLELAKGDILETSDQGQSEDSTFLATESGPSGVYNEPCPSKARASSNDSSAAIPRIMDLLKSQGPLPVDHQIELFLKLQISLCKLHVVIDPLRGLFQLILKKASSLPVFVLIIVANFYYRLGKFQEELQIRTMASKKVDHLDIPMKFDIYLDMGVSYEDLCLDVEALKWYKKAFLGYERLLGKPHPKTIRALQALTWQMSYLGQGDKALQLCDNSFMGDDSAPEIPIEIQPCMQYYRLKAYILEGDLEQVKYTAERLRISLKPFLETNGRKYVKNPAFLALIVAQEHQDDDIRLEFYSIAIKKHRKGLIQAKSDHEKLRYILELQTQLAQEYENLGRYQEAKDLLEKTLAEQIKVLPTDYEEIRSTRRQLNRLSYNLESGDVGDDDSSQVSSDDCAC